MDYAPNWHFYYYVIFVKLYFSKNHTVYKTDLSFLYPTVFVTVAKLFLEQKDVGLEKKQYFLACFDTSECWVKMS